MSKYEALPNNGNLEYVKVLVDDVDGELKAGMCIHSESRFWKQYQDDVAAGETVRPLCPEGYRWSDDTQSYEPIPKTPEELKLEGVNYNGVMCSATAEDMWGLASIKDWVNAGSSTNFKFANGNMLIITPSNLADFEAVWIPFRASFFT